MVRQFLFLYRVTDMFANPGKTIKYNGKTIKYPEIDLVYWAGGNSFVHHQDTNALLSAWRKPTTIIVHDMYWTPTAKMADIVFPITTPYERNDITMSRDYSNMTFNWTYFIICFLVDYFYQDKRAIFSRYLYSFYMSYCCIYRIVFLCCLDTSLSSPFIL